jgi:hypothetical protein
MDVLRDELVRGALELGLDLRGHENPADGRERDDGRGWLRRAGGRAGDNHYWAYGKDAEKIREEKDGGTDTLWYMAGPDDYVLHCPANVEKIRIATVVSRPRPTRPRASASDRRPSRQPDRVRNLRTGGNRPDRARTATT